MKGRLLGEAQDSLLISSSSYHCFTNEERLEGENQSAGLERNGNEEETIIDVKREEQMKGKKMKRKRVRGWEEKYRASLCLRTRS